MIMMGDKLARGDHSLLLVEIKHLFTGNVYIVHKLCIHYVDVCV